MIPPPLPLPPEQPALAPGERLLPTCIAAAVVVLLGDFLFWFHEPGVSLAIFAVVLAVLVVVRNWPAARGVRVWVAFALLILSLGQTAIEISFTNLAVITALFAVLLAELRYPQLRAGWARWSESLVAWVGAPGRWVWLVRALKEQPSSGMRDVELGARLGRLLLIALPAAALLLLFIVIFGAGNRIFAKFFSTGLHHVGDWLSRFDFEPGRIIFWLMLATLGLAFLRPRDGAKIPRDWAQPPKEWRRADAGMAFWQSVSILAVLNALFFAVNTIDVIYLWQRAAPPEGVVARDYLYEGVYSLITATVLAGVVLTFLFQQSGEVINARSLRVLAFAWIAQNFVLIAGAFLRLKLFLDVADMTEKRIYVACFLLLVAVGFVLLCWHVARGQLAGWLIWRNAVATFVLFFILQFLNVVGWVARENFARPLRTPEKYGLNVAYNMNLGPGSWPSLIAISQQLPPGKIRDEFFLDLRERARVEQERLGTLNWRGWQMRRDRNAAALVAWAAPFGKLSEEERQSSAIQRLYENERDLRGID